MAVWVECPAKIRKDGKEKKCGERQPVDNSRCKACNANLANYVKRQKALLFSVRQFSGRKDWKKVGFVLSDAKEADNDRAKKAKNGEISRDINEKRTTFKELADWYLRQPDTLLGKKRTSKKYGLNRKVKPRKKPYWSILKEGKPERPSWRQEASHLKQFCESRINDKEDPFYGKTFGELKIKDISHDHVSAYRVYQIHNFSDYTASDRISLLKKVMKRARKSGEISIATYLKWDDIDTVTRERKESKPKKIEHNDYVKFIQTAAKHPRLAHLRPIMITLYYTGMRPVELTRLQWDRHIQLEEGWIHMTSDITKTGKARWIPINGHIRAVLENLICSIDQRFVFSYNNSPFNRGAESFKRSFRTLCEKADIHYGGAEGCTFNNFRDSFITNMNDSGVNKTYRDMIAGHALPGMDEHYIATQKDKLREAMDQFTDYVDRQALKGVKRDEQRIGVKISVKKTSPLRILLN